MKREPQTEGIIIQFDIRWFVKPSSDQISIYLNQRGNISTIYFSQSVRTAYLPNFFQRKKGEKRKKEREKKRVCWYSKSERKYPPRSGHIRLHNTSHRLLRDYLLRAKCGLFLPWHKLRAPAILFSRKMKPLRKILRSYLGL